MSVPRILLGSFLLTKFSRFACAVCENWLHYGCLFEPGTTPPIGEDDFDVLICSRCVKSDRNGVRKLLDPWAGVAGRGVLLVGDAVEGALVVDETEEAELVGDLGEEEESLTTKRSLEDDSNDVEHKRPRLDITASPVASTSRLPDCSAPTVDEISPLDKIIAAGQPANVFLQEEYMERWCRCPAVRSSRVCVAATDIDELSRSVPPALRQTAVSP